MPKAAAPKTKMGRPKGVASKAREKRQLTPVQRLREHILIELNVDKADIAAAIGANRQTVSHVFLDVHRSEVEGQIVAYLDAAYRQSDFGTKHRIGALLGAAMRADGTTPDAAFVIDGSVRITAENLGWSQRSAPVDPPFRVADDEDEKGEA
jgi:hypothetical protein